MERWIPDEEGDRLGPFIPSGTALGPGVTKTRTLLQSTDVTQARHHRWTKDVSAP